MAVQIPVNELNEFSLPRVCVATGSTTDISFRPVKFQFVPRWVGGLAMIPLLYLLLAMSLRKRATGTLPFSETGWAKVIAARKRLALWLGGGALALVASLLLVEPLGSAGPMVVLGALVFLIVAIAVGARGVVKSYPRTTLIDDSFITLELPSKEAEQLIGRHLSSGARVR